MTYMRADLGRVLPDDKAETMTADGDSDAADRFERQAFPLPTTT